MYVYVCITLDQATLRPRSHSIHVQRACVTHSQRRVAAAAAAAAVVGIVFMLDFIFMYVYIACARSLPLSGVAPRKHSLCASSCEK